MGGIEQGLEGKKEESGGWIIGLSLIDKNKIVCV